MVEAGRTDARTGAGSEVALTAAPAGRDYAVTRVEGGRMVVRRLEGLGLFPGARLHKAGGVFTTGPVLVRAGGSDIAVGHGMAIRVFVREVAGSRP